ncbi:hypothetical protein ACRQ4C_13775 [Curtobacterium sp. SP.BCp]
MQSVQRSDGARATLLGMALLHNTTDALTIHDGRRPDQDGGRRA